MMLFAVAHGIPTTYKQHETTIAHERLEAEMDLESAHGRGSEEPEEVGELMDEERASRPKCLYPARSQCADQRGGSEEVDGVRKMVTDCLSGVTETLNTYGVRHDSFDFESELGWEGSNDKVLEIIRSSPYYVPETQCNEEGVPQGSYLNMTKFIADQKLPTGKKGYQKEYPNFYVLRPDGSTLYTFRDVVYSFKKASKADMILNVIASEQNLAQEKVALAMYMVGGKQMIGRQTHLTYDIVRLPHGKMSGRRGRYLLADDLYEELKDVIRGVMRAKYDEKGGIDEATFDAVTHEVSSASMKYALLSVGARVQVTFDMKKVTSFEDASAPFILYNSTRVVSLLNKFAERSAAGDARCPPLPRSSG